MATTKKVARSKGTKKQVKSPEYVKIERSEVERCRSLLERAQREAVMAAPQRIPRIGWGAMAALDAFETIWIVDGILNDALKEVQP